MQSEDYANKVMRVLEENVRCGLIVEDLVDCEED